MPDIQKNLIEQKLDNQRTTFLKEAPTYLGESFLKLITPNKGYRLSEDYLTILDSGRVLAPVLIYNEPGKATELRVQWGVNFISNLVADVTKTYNNEISVTFINTIKKMPSETWVKKQEKDAYNYSDKTSDAKNFSEKASAQQNEDDLSLIAQEINKGASYLAVGLRYMVSAKNVEQLDDFLKTLQNKLEYDIPGIIVALPNGDVDKTVSRLLGDPMEEPGRKMMFTSNEYAGFYNFVTQGIEDERGVYMGIEVGDINNTAVIWDMTNFEKRAVMSVDNHFKRDRDLRNGYTPIKFSKFTGSDLWVNSLILQLAREKQGNVYTIALDPFHMTPTLDTVTSTIDLNRGSINPFEMFGDEQDEIEIFSANQAKWEIITRQLAEQSIKNDSANRFDTEPISTTELSDLDSVLEEFYIDSRMWVKNAEHNRDKLRIVNLNHNEVPRLTMFIAYLQGAYDTYKDGVRGDDIKAHELNKLLAIYRRLQSTNSDLFDTVTSSEFDNMGLTRHTLFDYSKLSQRKGNILLIQLINSISAIANSTKAGDVIIIHGAQRIESLTQSYLTQIFNDLYAKDVRIVFSYNSSDAMLNDVKFNKMTSADWVLTGHLTADQVAQYNKLLGNQRQFSNMVSTQIQSNSDSRYYLRRYQTNVVFDADQYI